MGLSLRRRRGLAWLSTAFRRFPPGGACGTLRRRDGMGPARGETCGTGAPLRYASRFRRRGQVLLEGIRAFAGKRVLLLQGPVGPFFARLASDLRAVGAEVHKVNFHGGDWLYFRRGAMNYRGTMQQWPGWLEARMRALRIDVVFLFGDCRPIHRAAYEVATRLGVEVGVFEEGYVRPDYVTLERFGVNGFSRLPRLPDAYHEPPPEPPPKHCVRNPYWTMVWYGMWYFTVGALGKPVFPNYVHHRPLDLREAFPWVRSAWRKLYYQWTERNAQEQLTQAASRRFYLVPLQVFNDSQITVHARAQSIERFIEATVESFARHAPAETLLVFKHHPMDRGYRDYTRLIAGLAERTGTVGRLLYIHDQHLPSLLDHARGVVVINSTVGMSALHHGAPTIVCGNALYDIPGLTFQGALDDFWEAALDARPDPSLYRRFRNYLVAQTQLNGNFYRRLKLPSSAAGLVWGGSGTALPVRRAPAQPEEILEVDGEPQGAPQDA